MMKWWKKYHFSTVALQEGKVATGVRCQWCKRQRRNENYWIFKSSLSPRAKNRGSKKKFNSSLSCCCVCLLFCLCMMKWWRIFLNTYLKLIQHWWEYCGKAGGNIISHSMQMFIIHCLPACLLVTCVVSFLFLPVKFFLLSLLCSKFSLLFLNSHIKEKVAEFHFIIFSIMLLL